MTQEQLAERRGLSRSTITPDIPPQPKQSLPPLVLAPPEPQKQELIVNIRLVHQAGELPEQFSMSVGRAGEIPTLARGDYHDILSTTDSGG